jgi:membrane fusion protein (multidrug efflux system)
VNNTDFFNDASIIQRVEVTMQVKDHVKLIAFGGILTGLLLMAGCGQRSAATGPPPSAAPPEVGVVVVAPAPVALTMELTGRTTAHLIAEVRPQVGGIIQQRLFDEGADVKAGQLLFQIAPATYQAALNSATAALAKAEANLIPARLKERRFRELVAIKAVSQQDYDDAEATVKQAEAEVAVNQAAVESARINLEFTRVTAPIAGRIGRSTVTPGALVTANQASALATIQQLDPLYVDVTQSSADLLRLKRSLASGEIKGGNANQAKVKLLLEDGTPYPQEGILKFSDVTVEQTTGSVTLRTLFPNPHQLLLPGMFVRAILKEGVDEQGILVPQQGVTHNPKGEATALVVGAEDKVEPRVLKIDRAIGDKWLVREGLKSGDRLIVDGLQKIKPGMAVKVVMVGDSPEKPAAVSTPSPSVSKK